jgi:hypothetical protein
VRAADGELPFRVVRTRRVQKIGREKPQHRVAEELEALVVSHLRVALTARRGSERLFEKRPVRELVSEYAL